MVEIGGLLSKASGSGGLLSKIQMPASPETPSGELPVDSPVSLMGTRKAALRPPLPQNSPSVPGVSPGQINSVFAVGTNLAQLKHWRSKATTDYRSTIRGFAFWLVGIALFVMNWIWLQIFTLLYIKHADCNLNIFVAGTHAGASRSHRPDQWARCIRQSLPITKTSRSPPNFVSSLCVHISLTVGDKTPQC